MPAIRLTPQRSLVGVVLLFLSMEGSSKASEPAECAKRSEPASVLMKLRMLRSYPSELSAKDFERSLG